MAQVQAPRPVAAVDIGSNSVRLAVVMVDGGLYLEVVEEASAVPRLIQDVQRWGRLSETSIAEVISILRDFLAVARGAGADPTVAVATSAVRDAANGPELVARVREALGVDVRIVDGDEEARLAYLGAVHSLPVEDGLVVDIGGGSMEVFRFEGRRAAGSWTLPLGAVRLTSLFLSADPPTAVELRALREHITTAVAEAGIVPLPAGGLLVGTGGTVRNIAKMDRARQRYPIARLHGYEITVDAVRSVSDLVRTRTAEARRALPGLNEDRADVIVAGALVLQVLMEAVKAPRLVVSGQGLREGIALDARGMDVPPLSSVRQAAIDHMLGRFAQTHRGEALRRAEIVNALADAAGVWASEDREVLRAAALLLDLGRIVDYYDRHRQAEALVLAHGLPGWSHRELAWICAAVRQADSEKYDPLSAYRPLLTAADRQPIAGAGALLSAADEMSLRMAAEVRPAVVRQPDGSVSVQVDLDGERLRTISARLERAVGLRLSGSANL